MLLKGCTCLDPTVLLNPSGHAGWNICTFNHQENQQVSEVSLGPPPDQSKKVHRAAFFRLFPVFTTQKQLFNVLEWQLWRCKSALLCASVIFNQCLVIFFRSQRGSFSIRVSCGFLSFYCRQSSSILRTAHVSLSAPSFQHNQVKMYWIYPVKVQHLLSIHSMLRSKSTTFLAYERNFKRFFMKKFATGCDCDIGKPVNGSLCTGQDNRFRAMAKGISVFHLGIINVHSPHTSLLNVFGQSLFYPINVVSNKHDSSQNKSDRLFVGKDVSETAHLSQKCRFYCCLMHQWRLL